MKFRLALGLLALFAGWLTACESLPAETPVQTAEVIYVTATRDPATAAALPSNTPLPGFSAAPTPNGPYFSREILFATEPDPILATRNISHRTPQVYAMWRYSGMTNGLRVRREWLQNGDLYLVRDTDWDFEKYGASGLMSDTSIFDNANGLPPGHYELRLWIAGEPQFSEDDAPFRSFDLGIATTYPSLSPDGQYNLVVDNQSTLAVKDGSGRRRELARADGIAGYDWLPDSLHVVYSTLTDKSDPKLRQFDLWLMNVEGGAAEQINHPDESLSVPVVSPDGGRIAVVDGNGFGALCSAQTAVAFLELDRTTLKRARLIILKDFSGFEPPNAAAEPFVTIEANGPGVWKSPFQFETKVGLTCAENPDELNKYVLDLIALTAAKSAAP